MISCLLLASALLGVSGVEALDLDPALQDILNKAHQAPLYTYPTSLTQGIVPVCFSLKCWPDTYS